MIELWLSVRPIDQKRIPIVGDSLFLLQKMLQLPLMWLLEHLLFIKIQYLIYNFLSFLISSIPA